MPRSIPHLQKNQWPLAGIIDELLAYCRQLEHVRPKESRMATSGSCALWLPDHYANGPRDAFIDDHEFCHIHPAPHGSVHLMLPNPLRDRVVELSWAEPHPTVSSGIMPPSLVTVYAPRDTRELGLVLQLIRVSWRYARGELCNATPSRIEPHEQTVGNTLF